MKNDKKITYHKKGLVDVPFKSVFRLSMGDAGVPPSLVNEAWKCFDRNMKLYGYEYTGANDK